MAKKAKRGVKPGTKRGPYRKPETLNYNSVGNLPSLISDLTSVIDTLEAQLTAQIDRIKSILV